VSRGDPVKNQKASGQELPEDKLIAATLAALDSPLPESRQPGPEGTASTGSEVSEVLSFQTGDALSSPTLAALDADRRPKAGTVCESCPNSMWFSSPTEVKSYCRVMFLITWSTREPKQITGCDGIFLGQEE
jgi:hypothetical protein